MIGTNFLNFNTCTFCINQHAALAEPSHNRSSSPGAEKVEHKHHNNETVSECSLGPSHNVHKKKMKKLSKLWRTVSASDEEADTLKDCFWRNLERGILPKDFVGGDLYSSVCQFSVLNSGIISYVDVW